MRLAVLRSLNLSILRGYCSLATRTRWLPSVLAGSYVESFGSRQHPRQPSTIIFHPPQESHSVDYGSEAVRILSVSVDFKRLDYIREHSIVLDSPTSCRTETIAWLCRRIYQEFGRMDAASSLAIEGLVFEILAEASRNKERAADRKSTRWIERAREFLHDNFSEPLVLEDIAKSAGVHPVHLARVFRRQFGCTIVAQTEGKPFVWRGGDAVPQGWNCEFRWYKTDGLIAVVLTNRRIRAGSIRRYAMPHLVDIALFGKAPRLPAFTEVAPMKLRRLEGTYKLESGALFHVKAAEAATGEARTKPVLMISGEGQQAIDLLFSGAQLPGLEKLSLELNDKTSRYVEALRKNDLTALKPILPAGSSVEDSIKRWNKFVEQYGALEKFEIMGTSPLNQSGVQTFIRLKFRKTNGVYKVTWRDQKLWEQDEDRLQPEITEFLRKSFVVFPLNLPFLPQSETDFATFDPFKGRTINVSFSEGKLTVHRKDGDAVAQKVKAKPE